MIDVVFVASHAAWIVGLATALAAASGTTGVTRRAGLILGGWLTAAGLTALHAASPLAWVAMAVVTATAWREWPR